MYVQYIHVLYSITDSMTALRWLSDMVWVRVVFERVQMAVVERKIRCVTVGQITTLIVLCCDHQEFAQTKLRKMAMLSRFARLQTTPSHQAFAVRRNAELDARRRA